MIEKRKGYVKLGHIHGISLHIHWAAPAGGLAISAFSGFNLLEAAYYCAAYLILIFIHEFGHVAMARCLGLTVYAVDISAVGGQCRLQMPKTIKDAVLVYAGGLIAQLLLLGLTLLLLAVDGRPASPFGRCFVNTFTVANALLFIINLIPGRMHNGLMTDGLILWTLLRHAYRLQSLAFPLSSDRGHRFTPDTGLLSIRALVPDGFTTGIEILNDETTPMEFVVESLMRHLNMSRETAVKTMLNVHQQGGILIPLATMEIAERIAASLTAEAAQHHHRLVCRAVRAPSAVVPLPTATD